MDEDNPENNVDDSYTTRISVGDATYVVKGTYEAGPWRTVRVGGRPKAPANVRITRTTPNSVTLAWEAVTQTTDGGAVVGNVRYWVASNWESYRDCETSNGQTAKCFNGGNQMGRAYDGHQRHRERTPQ